MVRYHLPLPDDEAQAMPVRQLSDQGSSARHSPRRLLISDQCTRLQDYTVTHTRSLSPLAFIKPILAVLLFTAVCMPTRPWMGIYSVSQLVRHLFETQIRSAWYFSIVTCQWTCRTTCLTISKQFAIPCPSSTATSWVPLSIKGPDTSRIEAAIPILVGRRLAVPLTGAFVSAAVLVSSITTPPVSTSAPATP